MELLLIKCDNCGEKKEAVPLISIDSFSIRLEKGNYGQVSNFGKKHFCSVKCLSNFIEREVKEWKK